MIAAAFALALTLTGGDPEARVVIETSRGDVTLRLDAGRAPATTCNFLKYVTSDAYSGGAFFRTVVRETNDNPNPISVVQAATPAGSDDPGLGPIALERTRDTGLRHVAGTISMARDGPDTATSSFFIVVEDAPALDFGGGRNPDGQGFAAFGMVVEGMDVVREIHAGSAVDEALFEPVSIMRVSLTGDMPAVCAA
ncbi:MAG TPA: peptidylprolyl isomerase [Brevundimonas sp.]|jgi:peptidyl-prolyl cis-trans isomerase A (cyclophilin A)|uniref:peptidylprolyl isomerase n=1 Tax=Brevundimonas sp. TaxID=1871086 RepID=UPI002DEABE67|nr:peptidylprolyl isomerase [Brevundimonas sp.]